MARPCERAGRGSLTSQLSDSKGTSEVRPMFRDAIQRAGKKPKTSQNPLQGIKQNYKQGLIGHTEKSEMDQTLTHIDSSKFQDEVVRSSQPVLVDFYADWCGPCKAIEPVIAQLSKEYEGRVKFVKIDTDANQDLAIQFGIMSIPTVMFFARGKVEDIVIGAVPASVFKTKLDSLVKKA